MKKNDLKNGYVVDLRVNGYRRVVLFNELLIDGTGGYERASSLIEKYRDDLTHRSDSNLDIMKVYDEDMDLIWEREEVDWSKVPVGTKVKVSDDEIEWFNVYFIKKLSPIEDTNFYVINAEGKLSDWSYCKLAEEPKEEVTFYDVNKKMDSYCEKNNKSCDQACGPCVTKNILDNYNLTRK